MAELVESYDLAQSEAAVGVFVDAAEATALDSGLDVGPVGHRSDAGGAAEAKTFVSQDKKTGPSSVFGFDNDCDFEVTSITLGGTEATKSEVLLDSSGASQRLPRRTGVDTGIGCTHIIRACLFSVAFSDNLIGPLPSSFAPIHQATASWTTNERSGCCPRASRWRRC